MYGCCRTGTLWGAGDQHPVRRWEPSCSWHGCCVPCHTICQASCHRSPAGPAVSLNLLLCCSKLFGVRASARKRMGSALAAVLGLVLCSLLLNALMQCSFYPSCFLSSFIKHHPPWGPGLLHSCSSQDLEGVLIWFCVFIYFFNN